MRHPIIAESHDLNTQVRTSNTLNNILKGLTNHIWPFKCATMLRMATLPALMQERYMSSSIYAGLVHQRELSHISVDALLHVTAIELSIPPFIILQ